MASGPSCHDLSAPRKRAGRAPCRLNRALPTAKAGAKGGLQTPGPAAARGRARRRCSTRSRCQTASHLPASARSSTTPSQSRPRSHTRSSPAGSKGRPDRQHSASSNWGPPGEAPLRDQVRHQLASATVKKGLPYNARPWLYRTGLSRAPAPPLLARVSPSMHPSSRRPRTAGWSAGSVSAGAQVPGTTAFRGRSQSDRTPKTCPK